MEGMDNNEFNELNRLPGVTEALESGETGESTEVYVPKLRWRRLWGWSSEVALALETMRTVQV